MRAHMARLTDIILLLMLTVTVSCDVGSALFTKEELNLMYEVGLAQDGSPLASGFRAVQEEPLEITISSIDGAPEPASLAVSLTFANGTEIASITFKAKSSEGESKPTENSTETDIPASDKPAETSGDELNVAETDDMVPETIDPAANLQGSVMIVDDLLRDIPPFTVPDGLPDGYYVLSVSVKDIAGKNLSVSSTALLFFDGYLAAPSLAIYPGSVLAGRVSLLKLEGKFPEGIDPWIRWSVNGKVIAYGASSDMMDRLAWKAPDQSGIYLAKAEVFPFEPPIGFDIPPVTNASFRLPVSTTSIPVDAFDTLDAWSMFSFNGDLGDSGARPRTAEPVTIGTPYLETHASGYGYRLGNGSGIFSSSSLLPTQPVNGALRDVSVVFVTSPLPDKLTAGSGYLLTLATSDGSDHLILGIEKGYPYVASKKSRVFSRMPLPNSLSRLAVYISPTETDALVTFYIDDEPAGGGSILTGYFNSRPGSCFIAGELGYDAIYDEIKVLDGPYPSFWLSENARLGATLLTASGFEGGSTRDGVEPVGPAVLGNGFIDLPPKAALVIGKAPATTKDAELLDSSTLSFNLLDGDVAIQLALEDGTTLGIDTDGLVSIDGLNLVPILKINDGIKYSTSLEVSENSIKLYGRGKETVEIQGQPAPDARWILSHTGEEPARITQVTLSVFEAPATGEHADSQEESDSSARNPLQQLLLAKQ